MARIAVMLGQVDGAHSPRGWNTRRWTNWSMNAMKCRSRLIWPASTIFCRSASKLAVQVAAARAQEIHVERDGRRALHSLAVAVLRNQQAALLIDELRSVLRLSAASSYASSTVWVEACVSVFLCML